MSSQNAHFKSQYHDAFAAIMKITYRDGNASETEQLFLKHLSNKLGISENEYDTINNTYMNYDIVAPYLHQQRVEHFYKVVEVVYSDKYIDGDKQTKWLTRMATAMGFDPSNVKYIVAKSLDLFNDNCDFESYKEGIDNMMI
ncbi:TerB family tellurite resistance protein [uncultured Psychroserpens sp.]|uniref:TerB family tellurite resistance protein n=1 Tax=uncultured Psychroserpens sp. TaxID=255436 RepID=UPI00262B4CB8|nr:TerB family tellurite resistance protein [uncultured Psychroserpens sp.]